MDPSLVVGTGLAVLGSKDILNRLLGPTADYLGGEISQFVKKCNINLDRVFASAVRRLDKGMDEPGSVTSRVLKEIVSEGRFCEDELTTEYYGGLLATSRTREGTDDTVLPYLSLIRELSTSQIRLHYIVYATIHRLFKGNAWEAPDVTKASGCDAARIELGGVDLFKALQFGIPDSKADVFERASRGLEYRRLLIVIGRDEDYEDYEAFEPTPDGADLFMMVNGKRGYLSEFFEYELKLPHELFPMPSDFRRCLRTKSSSETPKPTTKSSPTS